MDFFNKVLFGAATLEVKRLDPRATELVLDTRDLDIRDVSENAVDVLGATVEERDHLGEPAVSLGQGGSAFWAARW